MHQLSKIIQNPSYVELQKAANQGRRCTWEKLSAIKANCGIELALDECVAILNHMRRLKRSAERAAAASHGLSTTVKFSGARRIPSWNVIARENSTSSLEDYLTDAASSLHQGVNSSGGATGKNRKPHRITHDASDSESESADLNSWTRSGGPLMRTTSADMFIDFVKNLEVDTELNRGMGATVSPHNFQYHSSRLTTPDRCSEISESDQKENGNNRVVMNGSSITVTEGDLLQPERIHNGIVFNVVRKEDLTPSNRSHDYDDSYGNEVAESVQIYCPGNEKDDDASSASADGDDNYSATARSLTDTPDSYLTVHSSTDLGKDQSTADTVSSNDQNIFP